MQIKHATWDAPQHARILQAEAEIAHILCEINERVDLMQFYFRASPKKKKLTDPRKECKKIWMEENLLSTIALIVSITALIVRLLRR